MALSLDATRQAPAQATGGQADAREGDAAPSPATATRTAATSAGGIDRDFAALYAAHFAEVCRWVRALGGPEADLEDLSQEIFLVARRRLPDFDGANARAWLYRIASNTVSDYRRRAWFRNLFRRRSIDGDERDGDEHHEGRADQLSDGADGPSEILEKKESERRLLRLLAGMSDKRRATFVLFEIEGYSGVEIAALSGVPLKTVWTRLHHARKELLARLRKDEP